MQSNHFINRLQVEKKIISKELPQFEYFQTLNENCFRGTYKTSARGNCYELKIVLEPNYPDEIPQMYVSSPKTLWMHGKKMISLNSKGISHKYHTNSNSLEGYVQICHYSSDTWHAAKTCTAVAVKGLLWCEAFDIHLTTGLTIAQIIENLQRCQEENTGDLMRLFKNTSRIDFSGIKLTNSLLSNPLPNYLDVLSFKPEKKLFDLQSWQID